MRERGQAVVEFAIICSVLFMLTVGLLGVGQAFFQYNAVSAAARYGARWGAVVGGTCEGVGGAGSDWCTQLGQQSTQGFWAQPGNAPLQAVGTSCPGDDKSTASPSPYYTVSAYTGGTATTIVGAIAQRFDSGATSSNFISGGLTPGFDLSKLKVCIQLPSLTESTGGRSQTIWNPMPGSMVQVFVYYRFSPAGTLLTNATLPLFASSRYVIE